MKVIFVRHGDANYSKCDERKFIGLGLELAPLSDLGISQINKSKKDIRLKDADIIISSPFTRALQSALIISNETNVELKIEMDLHEWLPDLSFSYKSSKEGYKYYHEFMECMGVKPTNRDVKWESFENVKKRVFNVLKKYKSFDKIIVVCHGVVMSAILDGKDPNFEKTIDKGEIFLYEYS